MTAAPAVKALDDAIITSLGIEQVLVVGRNAQGFALSRKPVGPSQVHSALSPKNAASLIRREAAVPADRCNRSC
jgi:hypothetical protein